ncbi:MAG: MATE family efflux transporter, partial [Eubacterium sp.]
MKKNNTPTENILGTGSIGKLIATFAIPSVIAMLVNALYNIVDQIFIGHRVGYLGNGAANVVLLTTLVTLALSLLIGDGAASFFSLHLGAGKKEAARNGVLNALFLIVVLSLVTLVFCLIFLEPILRLFGATDVILPYALDYGFIIVLGLPFIMISTSINALIRADGSPKYAMLSMILGAVINGCLDPVFIFVLGLGIKGAAISTFIGQFISFALSIAYLKRFKSVTLSRRAFSFQFKTAKQICGLGISSFIDQIAFTMVMVVNNNLIIHYGATSPYGSEILLTAYGLSMKVQEILFTLLLGIAIGMQPIVGYNYGAKNYGRVKKAYSLSLVIGTLISIAATVIFVFFPDPIIHLFGSQDNALYLEFSKKFFQTYFILYIFFGFQTITGVFFQAIGKPAQTAAISLSYQLVFKILSALLLTTIIGLDGVLWSGPFADALTFILSLVLIVIQMRKIGK